MKASPSQALYEALQCSASTSDIAQACAWGRASVLHKAAASRRRRRQGNPQPKAVAVRSSNLIYWIPFGDHPLKLERYRED